MTRIYPDVIRYLSELCELEVERRRDRNRQTALAYYRADPSRHRESRAQYLVRYRQRQREARLAALPPPLPLQPSVLDFLVAASGALLAKKAAEQKRYMDAHPEQVARKKERDRIREARKRPARVGPDPVRPSTWSAPVFNWLALRAEEELAAQRKAYPYRVNPTAARALKAAWRAANPDKHRQNKAAWRAKRRAQRRPEDLVEAACRGRLIDVVSGRGGKKSARTQELLGCTWTFLREHLESQFQPGMTWKNYGSYWHVDYIRPCASFDLLDPEQQKQCFHFSNLQPLTAADNIAKGAKYEPPVTHV